MPYIEYNELCSNPGKYSEIIFKSKIKSYQISNFLKNTSIYLADTYKLAEEKSHDPRTHVGAAIYNLNGERLFTGANTLSKGTIAAPHTENSSVEELRTNLHAQKEYKYFYMEHAERNAIFDACFSSYRVSLYNKIMVCPYFACADCSRVIARSKISLIIGHKDVYSAGNPLLMDSIKAGREILDGAGIYYTEYVGKIGCSPIMMNGSLFYP